MIARARLIALVLLAASAARAEELSLDLRVDLPIVGAAVGFWVGTEAAKRRLAPATCQWCDGDDLNALDRGFRSLVRWQDTRLAHDLSNVAAFAAAPVAAVGLSLVAAGIDRRVKWRALLIDLVLLIEAFAIASDVNQAVKFAAGRERPFVRALPPDERARLADGDNNLSFFSGHTTFAFALAAASGTIATVRGYRWARLVWAVGMPVAVSVALLRVAGDRHYLSDVFVGSLVGTGIGVAVPLLHRDRSPVRPFVAGGVVGVAGAW